MTTDTSLESQATQAALEANWESAISLNKAIVKAEPEDLGAWNRLGRAYSEVGMVERAKSAYREVLKHDPYNSIALKNLDRLKVAGAKGVKITGSSVLDPDLFLETPGKTKILELSEVAQPEILAALHTGDKVKILPLESAVKFEDSGGTKLGLYQGELAGKLSEMLRAGSAYAAYVKSVESAGLKIFVREVERTPKYAGVASFPIQDNGFKPYVHEGAVSSEPIVHDGQEEMPSSVEEPEPGEPSKKAPSVETLAESEAEEPEQD